MKVYITGENGFIGKNLKARLNVLKYEFANNIEDADFIFHLAGSNRPKDNKEFYQVNRDYTKEVVSKANCPILFTSTKQVGNGTDYAISKEQAENLLSSKDFIYRLPGVFGKWSKPNYNTVVATFCHNISRDLPIVINNPDIKLELVYIDDVVDAFIETMEQRTLVEIKSYSTSLPNLADTIKSFKMIKTANEIPSFKDELTVKLYATYLSFVPDDMFSYDLTMHKDERGSFTEFLKLNNAGQISVNVISPGVEKGNHWHDTKNEKFLVVSGEATVKFRKYGTNEIITYTVSGNKHQVIDIPTGYIHSIANNGDKDCVFIIWASEWFCPDNADTHFSKI